MSFSSSFLGRHTAGLKARGGGLLAHQFLFRTDDGVVAPVGGVRGIGFAVEVNFRDVAGGLGVGEVAEERLVIGHREIDEHRRLLAVDGREPVKTIAASPLSSNPFWSLPLSLSACPKRIGQLRHKRRDAELLAHRADLVAHRPELVELHDDHRVAGNLIEHSNT